MEANTPQDRLEAAALAALGHALTSSSPEDAALRLLRGLLGAEGIHGGLLVAAADGTPRVLASVDLPDPWVDGWRQASPAELDARLAAGLLRESLGILDGQVAPDLKLSGFRGVWTLPLSVSGDPHGALVLVSREEDPFPEAMRAPLGAVAEAFGGWLRRAPRRAASAESATPNESPAPPSRPENSAAAAAAPAESFEPAILRTLESQPDFAVIRLDAEGIVRTWPAQARRLFGDSEAEALGQPFTARLNEIDALDFAARHRGELKDQGEWEVELNNGHGEIITAGVRFVRAGDANPPAAGPQEVLLFVRDRGLDEASERWLRWSRTLLSVLGGSTLVLDPGGRVRELGLGWTRPNEDPASWLGQHVADLFENDRPEILSALRTAAREGEWSGKLNLAGRPVSLKLLAVHDGDGRLEAIVGARLPDVTGESREIFRSLPVGMLLVDPDLRILQTNPELTAILGKGALPVEPVGIDIRSLPAFQTRAAQSALDDLTVTAGVDLPELELRRKNGETQVVQLRGNALHDEQGRRSGYLLTMLGRNQGNGVERQLLRAHKMESIGNFASGLAHDFGNFVSVILGKAGVLRVKLPADPHITRDLDDIETAAKRAQHLAQELMKFARGGRNSVAPMSINDMIQEVGTLVSTSVGKRISVDFRLDDGVPEIRGDEVELQQMVLNLCLNARDAMENGGRLVIETRPLTEEQRVRLSAGDPVSGGCCLSVRDTGAGMPPEVVERIFEPFFTTKDEANQGTGLGLAMVYGIVRRHGGTIDVRSHLGVGTTFEILLPAAAEEDAVSEPQTNVLVVDDEPAFREMVQMILEEDGYAVQLAANGIDALKTLRQQPESLGLVILDLHMPGVDGLRVLEELQEMSTDLPVLVTTGYASPEEKEKAKARGARAVLEKPYRVADLRQAVIDAIAPAPEGIATDE